MREVRITDDIGKQHIGKNQDVSQIQMSCTYSE